MGTDIGPHSKPTNKASAEPTAGDPASSQVPSSRMTLIVDGLLLETDQKILLQYAKTLEAVSLERERNSSDIFRLGAAVLKCQDDKVRVAILDQILKRPDLSVPLQPTLHALTFENPTEFGHRVALADFITRNTDSHHSDMAYSPPNYRENTYPYPPLHINSAQGSEFGAYFTQPGILFREANNELESLLRNPKGENLLISRLTEISQHVTIGPRDFAFLLSVLCHPQTGRVCSEALAITNDLIRSNRLPNKDQVLCSLVPAVGKINRVDPRAVQLLVNLLVSCGEEAIQITPFIVHEAAKLDVNPQVSLSMLHFAARTLREGLPPAFHQRLYGLLNDPDYGEQINLEALLIHIDLFNFVGPKESKRLVENLKDLVLDVDEFTVERRREAISLLSLARKCRDEVVEDLLFMIDDDYLEVELKLVAMETLSGIDYSDIDPVNVVRIMRQLKNYSQNEKVYKVISVKAGEVSQKLKLNFPDIFQE